MKHFEVYFEIFSKKMKTVVKAHNSEDAALIVRKHLIIHKAMEVEPEEDLPNFLKPDPKEDPMDMLKRMFGMN